MLSLTSFGDNSQLIAFFSSLFHHALESVALHDQYGQPLYYNPSILRHLNLDADTCPHLESLREVAPAYCEHLEQVLMTGKPGKMIYDEIHFLPIFDAEHSLKGVLCLGRDLGYLRQKNIATTQKQKEYLSTLIDSLPFPVWMKNQQGNYLAINKKASLDLGMASGDNLESTTDFDYFDAPQAEMFVNDDKYVMQTGQAKVLVETIRKKDGSAYLSYTHKTPVFVDDKVVGTVGFSRNIAEEQKLQQTITELENDYFAILNNLPLLIIVYDLECRRVFLNQHYLQCIGEKSQALIGTKPSERWMPGFISITGLEFEAQLKHAMTHNVILPVSCTLEGATTRFFEKKLIPRLNTQQEVCGVICIAQDVTDVYQARKALEHQAHYDALTGLANRTLFSNYLNEAVTKAKQNNQPFVVMLLDLDRFKAINDSMGHAVGDVLLKEVANRICSAHSDAYICSRLGGDEFAILYSDYSCPRAPEALADSILSAVSNVYQIDGAEYFISASIGVTVYPDDTDNDANLLKYADTAMYAAKDAGRNTYSVTLLNIVKRQSLIFISTMRLDAP